MKTVFSCLLAALAVLGTSFAPACAQDYPNRPIKLFIAFPVGGLLDTVSRIVGEKMSGILGQQFVIEARTGAGGTLATAAVARAEPDGYTLMMINDNHALNPSVFKNIPYDSVKDFAPIGFVGSTPLLLVVNADVPAKSVQEFIALAKEKPGSIAYGSVGPGSAPHLGVEMFAAAAGVKLQHVPYRGGAPALNDLLAGHIQATLMSGVVAGPHLQAGKLRALALAAKDRLGILPEVPTLAETGFPLEASYWFGLVAPAATPAPIIAKLEKALGEVLAMPDVKKRLTDMGAVIAPLSSRQFGDYIQAETKKWADVIAQNKIVVQQ